MMAMSKKMPEQEPGQIEALLPWHAAGTLSARDARRVEEAIARDPELAKQYAVIREEYAATIDLNESLGVPSSRAMHKLFAAIDAEPARNAQSPVNVRARISGFLARLSPRALAWSASLGALALLLQAGVIGAMLARQEPAATFKTASYQHSAEAVATGPAAPMTRNFGAEPAPRVFVRFAPDARASEITALLDAYQASVIDSAKGGTFRLQLGDRPLPKQDLADLMNRLQSEKIIALALPAP